MKNNIAKLVRAVAIVLLILGIAVSVLCNLPGLSGRNVRTAAIVNVAVGILASFVVFALILGFSELIEKADEACRYQKEIRRILVDFDVKGVPTYKAEPVVPSGVADNSKIHAQQSWACSNCGRLISSSVCPHCNCKQNI